MSVTGLRGSPDAFNHKESMFRTVTISEKWRGVQGVVCAILEKCQKLLQKC